MRGSSRTSKDKHNIMASETQKKKKQALVVFGGREVTICEDSLPDLDNNGDVHERMFQKHNNHFVPRKNKRHARFRLRQNQQKSHQTIMQFYLECRELVRLSVWKHGR